MYYCLVKKEDTPILYINRYIKNVSKFNSIDYDIKYKIKFYSLEDTLKYKVHCTLIRDPKDTIFGGAIWINNDSIERFYDLKIFI